MAKTSPRSLASIWPRTLATMLHWPNTNRPARSAPRRRRRHPARSPKRRSQSTRPRRRCYPRRSPSPERRPLRRNGGNASRTPNRRGDRRRNSGTVPRSRSVCTRARKLSLQLRYYRTQSAMISWSNCRPLNNSDAGVTSTIWVIIAALLRSRSLCTRAP
jgi:hypothetical protein